MMPVHQHGSGSIFNVYGDYNDYGPQINGQMGGPVDAASQTEYIYVPPLPLSPRFTGQEVYLGKLREYFAPQIHGSRPGRKCFLLHGMGGVGKTQLSLKFTEENADRFWIFWVDAASRETMEQGIKDIAEDPVAKRVGVEPSTRSVLQWLSRTDHEWLLVFDNADGHPDSLTHFMPTGSRGNILITSRNPMMAHHVSSPEARVEVDAMEEDDAVCLLLKSALLEGSSNDAASLARVIVRELCCLPLAVDQAGAAIACGLCNIRDYLDRYFVRRRELMSLTLFKGASDYGRAVYATWELSYAAIQDGASGASKLMVPLEAECSIFLLEFFSCFHNENILEDIFRRAAEAPVQANIETNTTITEHILEIIQRFTIKLRNEHIDTQLTFRHDNLPRDLLKLDASGRWDPQIFRAGIQILNSFSLIKRHTSGDSYSVHPLVHSWSRDRMIDDARKVNMCHSASSLLAHSITWEYLVADRAFRRDLIPHIKSCTLRLAEAVQPEDYTVEELSHFGLAYYENGLYGEAAELQEKCMTICTKVCGVEHPNTLGSMHYLALTYRDEGRYKEAEKMGLRVFELKKKVLGEEHPDTLSSMQLLASTYLKQGHHKEAEVLGVRVLELEKKVLGEEHPDTLASMHNLASTYKGQGRYKEAEELGVRVLELEKNVLGEEHPETLLSMNNLASTYIKQGRYKEAEELGIRALELKKKVLGEEHPDTLLSMHNLASTYGSQGRHKEAEKMGLRVMELRKSALGEEHPDTLNSMHSLVMRYKNQGRYKEAEELGVRVLDLMMHVLGEEHPTTLASMHNLASTYHSQGRYKEAEEQGARVSELKKKVLGEEHPDTLSSMHNLASTYNNQGHYKEAEEMMMRVLESKKKVLGEEHPDTLQSMHNLASTYGSQGRQKEAEKMGLQVLELKKKVLGEEHPDTLLSMHNLASIYKGQRRYKEAGELGLRVLDLQKKVLGEEHPNTLACMQNLSLTYWSQGHHKEAEEMGMRVLELKKKVLGVEHPSTLVSMHSLAYIQISLGAYQDAIGLMRTAVDLHAKLFGSNHRKNMEWTRVLQKWTVELEGTSIFKSVAHEM